jgi:peptide chain release factor 2
VPDTFPLQNDGHEDKVLSSQSYELKKKVPYDKHGKLAGEKKVTAWERQIQPYMFQPCQLVKDRHTGVESGNLNTVMDRDLNQFIDA